MASEQFRAFLVRSMALLAREKPALYTRLEDMLAGRELELVIDDAPLALRFAPAMTILPRAEAPDIRLRSSRAAILEVMDGHLSLEDAVLEERIVLIGALPRLVLFHDALLLYLHGAVRAPSFPALFAAYRAGASARPDRDAPPADPPATGLASPVPTRMRQNELDELDEGESHGRPD